MNLQLRTSCEWSQRALAELPQLKIRNVLNVSVCQIFFSFLFELRDGFSVILRPPPHCAWDFFLESGGIQREPFQASLAFTAALTLLTTIRKEDKHFP